MFNFVTNIESCYYGISNLIYYTHMPAVIIALFVGFFVFFKNRHSLLAKILLIISILFSTWAVSNLIVWINPNSIIVTFVWSFFGIIIVMLSLTSIYFTQVYITKKDVTLTTKIIWLILLLPLIIFIKQSASEFDTINCEVIINHNYDNYGYAVGLISFLWILIFSITKYFKAKGQEETKQIIYLTLGVLAFLISFFITGFLASYWDNFYLEQYGLFGMVIFMAFLAYLIVNFKAFNIKLLATQALVWSLIIIIGSEFFFIQTDLNRILTAITLIISGWLGLIIIRSVKKEVTLREHLEIANAGQSNLIHIMNHQIKGYLTISKNIFAELLTDDYGVVPVDAKVIIAKGLDSSDKGQRYVTAILKGASAESGSLSYDITQFDFKNLVSEVFAKEKEIADKKGLKLEIDILNGDYNMMGDNTQLGEAVRNLIENSICYTPAGNIHVNLKRLANKIILSVKDTGVGIKAEDRDKIFKAGGVGTESIKINVNSSGYGLAFVKGVIEKHKGKVSFESAGAGLGSTFFVELPVK